MPTFASQYTSGILRPVKDWVDRVKANGGKISDANILAVNTFYQDGIDNAWLTRVERFNPFAGSNGSAALVPLIVGNGLNVDTNVSCTFSGTSGFTGNGTSAYLRTGFSWFGVGANNNSHLGVYMQSYGTSTSAYVAGVFSVGTISIGVVDSSTVTGRLYGFTEGSSQRTINRGLGMLFVNRTASNSLIFYNEGTASTTATGAAGTYPTGTAPAVRDMVIFANNNAGTIESFFAGTIGCYTFGKSMSLAQYTAFRSAVSTLMTAFRRQI